MDLSALVWACFGIGVACILLVFALLEISAFRHGSKLRLLTLSSTVWAAETKYPALRPVIGILCGIIGLSFLFLIAHFVWEVP